MLFGVCLYEAVDHYDLVVMLGYMRLMVWICLIMVSHNLLNKSPSKHQFYFRGEPKHSMLNQRQWSLHYIEQYYEINIGGDPYTLCLIKANGVCIHDREFIRN